MFDDSDFEFDDEAIDVVMDNTSTVAPNKTVPKRPCEEEKTFQEQGQIPHIYQCVRPVKKPKESDTIPNNFQNATNDVYDQFCNIARTSIKFDCANNGDRLSVYNKPSSSLNIPRNISRKVVQRKFPGPAGLLPEKLDRNNPTKTIDEDFYFKNMQNTQEPMLVSQCCELSFDDKLWKRMLEDLEVDGGNILPDKYNIEWIKDKASNSRLINEKAPFLAALIQSIECSKIQSPVLTVTLKDKTGEIQATIDYDLYKEYIAELIVGSIIIIKQFSVVSTGTSYMLIVTFKNLIRIYHENNDKNLTLHEEIDDNILLENPTVLEQFKIISVQDLSVKDIIKNINEIRDYKKRTEINDEALGVFLDNFNQNFDRNKPNFTNKSSSVNLLNNNQPKCTSQITNFSFQSKSCTSPQNFNTIPQKLSSNNIKNKGRVDNVLDNKKPKFNFKATRFNKENEILNTTHEKQTFISSQSCSQISVKTDNVEEKKIVENIFEGLDADSFFEDF